MVHRKIIDPALAKLDGQRMAYFSAVADMIGRDSRAEGMLNLVFLVFKTTLPFLPTHLSEADLAERLFVFVADNQAPLNRIIHDRDYLEHPERLSRVTDEFLHQMLAETLEHGASGATGVTREKGRGKGKTYRFSWPDLDTDFPYRDDEE